jgi:hypothetical protein
VKCPVPVFVARVTAPEGEDPVTVTVHVVKLPTCVVLGEHDTASVEVVRGVADFTSFNEKLPVAAVL